MRQILQIQIAPHRGIALPCRSKSLLIYKALVSDIQRSLMVYLFSFLQLFRKDFWRNVYRYLFFTHLHLLFYLVICFVFFSSWDGRFRVNSWARIFWKYWGVLQFEISRFNSSKCTDRKTFRSVLKNHNYLIRHKVEWKYFTSLLYNHKLSMSRSKKD